MTHRIKDVVETWIFKIVTPILGTMSVALLVFLFIQNIDRIDANAEDIKTHAVSSRIAYDEYCEKTEDALKEKVSNKELIQTLEIINFKQDMDAERWKEQKKFNKETVKLIQSLNKNVLLRNERMKDEPARIPE